MKRVPAFTRVFGSITVIACVGCAPDSEDPKDLMALYNSDREARDRKIDECKQNAGFIRKELDCLIAAEALKKESIGSFKNLPPLDLEEPRKEKKPASGDGR